jgi:hypothetical protein
MKKNIFFILLVFSAAGQLIGNSTFNESGIEMATPTSKEQIIEYIRRTDDYRSIEIRYAALLATWENIRFEHFWYNVDDTVITDVINQLLAEYYSVSKNRLNGEALRHIEEKDVAGLRNILAEGPYWIYQEEIYQ